MLPRHERWSGLKVKSVKRLTDQKYLNLFDIAYQDRLGQQRHWQMASRSGQPKVVDNHFHLPDAVIIVPYHATENRLVIIREFRVTLGGCQYGFPAGLVDPGESVEATAARELMEETGLRIQEIVRVSCPLFSSSGMTDESVAMVYARCIGTPSTHGNQGAEQIEVMMVSPQDAQKICSTPDLPVDVKTWLVLHAYAQTGSI